MSYEDDRSSDGETHKDVDALKAAVLSRLHDTLAVQLGGTLEIIEDLTSDEMTADEKSEYIYSLSIRCYTKGLEDGALIKTGQLNSPELVTIDRYRNDEHLYE